MDVVMVRHGESAYNVEGRVQGQHDSPLTPRGRLQAEAVAARLAACVFDRCYSSDLVRAADTANSIVRSHPGLDIEYSSSLREMRMGVLEGQLFTRVADQLGANYAEWIVDRRSFTPEGGETVYEVHSRAREAASQLLADVHDHSVLVVSHNEWLKSFVSILLGMRFEDRGIFEFGYTSITVVNLASPKVRRLSLYNDRRHLDAVCPTASPDLPQPSEADY